MLECYQNNTDTKLIKLLDQLPDKQAVVVDIIVYKLKAHSTLKYTVTKPKQYPDFIFIEVFNQNKTKEAFIAVYLDSKGTGGFDLDLEFRLSKQIVLDSASEKCKNFGCFFGRNKYWVIGDVLSWMSKD